MTLLQATLFIILPVMLLAMDGVVWCGVVSLCGVTVWCHRVVWCGVVWYDEPQ